MKGAAAGIRSSSTWAAATGPAKGGEVLSVLAEKLERTSGDPTARELYSTLLLRASQPYVSILVAWITTGQLADPWEEFIVKETRGITQGGLDLDYTDEYWERRYTLRDKGAKKASRARESHRARGLSGGAIVPTFLDPWKNKILLAGKYLNVIRECGIEIKVEDTGLGTGLVAMDDDACVFSFSPSCCGGGDLGAKQDFGSVGSSRRSTMPTRTRTGHSSSCFSPNSTSSRGSSAPLRYFARRSNPC